MISWWSALLLLGSLLLLYAVFVRREPLHTTLEHRGRPALAEPRLLLTTCCVLPARFLPAVFSRRCNGSLMPAAFAWRRGR